MRGSIVTREGQNGIQHIAVYRNSRGKQKWKSFRKKKNAEIYLNKKLADQERRAAGLAIGISGAEWFKRFDDYLARQLALGKMKPSTVSSYRSVIKLHIRPFFEPFVTDKITHEDTETWANDLAEKVSAGEIAGKYYNNIVNVLSALIAWSRKPSRLYMEANLMADIERADVVRQITLFHDPETVAKLLRRAEGAALIVCHLAAYAGLRRAEIAALQRGDIDHEKAQIHVSRGISGGRVTKPKTATSIRDIDVTASTLRVLDEYLTTLPSAPAAWLFPSTTTDGPMHPDSLDALVTPAFLAVGVPGKLHSLRHYYASLLIANGEPAKYVSEQMGHASIQITMDLYGHLFKETRREAMARLDARITPQAAPSASDIATIVAQAVAEALAKQQRAS